VTGKFGPYCKCFFAAAAFGFVMGGAICGYAKHHFHGGSVNDAASIIQVASVYEALVGSSSVPGLKPMLEVWEKYQKVLQKKDSNGATEKATDVLDDVVASSSSAAGFGGTTVAGSERNVDALLSKGISYDTEDQTAYVVNADRDLQKLADYERQVNTEVLNGARVSLGLGREALNSVSDIVAADPQEGYLGSVQQGNAELAILTADRCGQVGMLYGELAHEAAVKDRLEYEEKVDAARVRRDMWIAGVDPYNPTARDREIMAARTGETNRFAGRMFGD